jgi:predicted chitinase
VALLAGLAAYAFAAARLGAALTAEPGLAQLAFYVVAGVAWVWPAARLVRWMRRDDR